MGISKHKIIFAKGSTPNWSEEVFVIKNVKNNVIIFVIKNVKNNVIKDLMVKKLLERKKITKDKMKQSLEFKKLIKK